MQQKNNLYVMMLYTQKSKLVYSIMEKEIKPKQHQHQSESITLRSDSIILNKLQHEAEQKDTSVNALVTHIIRRHIDWHSNATKAGFVTVRRGLLIDLINRLPDKEISSIAEYITKNDH